MPYRQLEGRSRTRPYAPGSQMLLALLALALSACGGGGGGSGGSGAGTGTPVSSPPVSTFSLIGSSSQALFATATTSGTGNSVLNDPVTFSVAAPGSYYYQLSFQGTAISAVSISGESNEQFNTTNPTIVASDFLGYAIGATVSGSWSGGMLQISQIDLDDPQLLGAGLYHDALTLRLCADTACTQQAAGSPITIALTYAVTGNPLPAAQVTPYPNVQIEAPATQTTAPSGSILVQASALPPTGAYVTAGPSVAGLVTGSAFTAPLSPGPGTPPQGQLTFSLLPPATAGIGIHTDAFPLNVCFQPACANPVPGSPWTANVTYIVDPVAGQDFIEHSLGIAVGGIVWDAQNGQLYVLSASYSPLDPNMLLDIDPSTATIVQAVTLTTGADQLQPGTLAISSDDQYLYVAMSNPANTQVERLSTSNLSVDLSFTLPAYTMVNSLAPAPGAPATVAVLTEASTPQLMIYDNATPRAGTLSGQNGALLLAFTWGADATTLYADFGGSSDSVAEIAAGASGPTVTQSYTSSELAQAMVTTNGNRLQFVNGRVIFGSGAIFDPSTFTLATPFPVDTSTAPSAAFDTTLNRAYFVSTDQPANATTLVSSIESFNLATQTPLWFARFPGQTSVSYLTRWGNDGLAFSSNAGSGSLVLISGPFIAQ